MKALSVVTVFLAAITMGMALAHALELPGKMRLPKEAYLATQTIYYPGFTIGGMAEPAAALAALALLVMMPAKGSNFWLMLGAVVALVALHAVFWIWIQPVNKTWLKDIGLRDASATFFRTATAAEAGDKWTKLRNRWEYAHAARAGLGLLSLVLLLVAVVP